MTGTTRRGLLSATAIIAFAEAASAKTYTGTMPWSPNYADPAQIVTPGGWKFFTDVEAQAVDAILARLIPTDQLGLGAKDTGGTVFIDRQLAGPYGGHDWLYMQGPFPANPLPQQGLQSPVTPRDQYRQGLKALDAYCSANLAGRNFAALSPDEQDLVLTGLQKGEIKLDGRDARGFFNRLLTNAQEGFFADPIHGGNQGMAGWKLVGFPGVRYDYRDVIANPNKPYTLPPVSLQGRAEWESGR